MSNKHHIGKSVNTIEASKEFLPYTKVVIIAGEDESGTHRVYEAGNDTGRTLEVTNPWGTQQIANEMLIRIQGYTYKPYSASGAYLPDTAELGDGVTVNGIYSVLASQDLTFDGLSVSDIEAPGADETENEFGIYVDSTQKDLKRKVNTISTKFTVELGKIESEINDTATGLSTRITQNTNSITSEVTRATQAEGTLSSRITQTSDSVTSEITRATSAESTLSSRIDQRLDSITLSVSSSNGSSTFTLKDGTTTLDTKTLNMTVSAVNISGTLTANQIDATNLHVLAANVDGQLVASQINTSGLTVDYALTANTATIASSLTAQAISAINIDASQITSGTIIASALKGSIISINDAGNHAQGNIQVTEASSGSSAINHYSNGALRFYANDGDVYIRSNTGYVTLSSDVGITVHNQFMPISNYDLGGSANYNHWDDIYALNGTIQTSDLRVKKDIEYGLSDYEQFFMGLTPCTYRFKNGHDRLHFGMIAQDIEQLIATCGMDTKDVAAFIKSYDEKTEDYSYGLRYGEFIPLIIWEVQQLKARVKELAK